MAKKDKRSRQIQKAVQVGTEQWYKTLQEPISFTPSNGGVINAHNTAKPPSADKNVFSSEILVSLPPRQPITAETKTDFTPPMMRFASFKPSSRQVVGRFFRWGIVVVYFFAGILWDKVRRRDSIERRAVRLRKILESTGGTFVKIGQQMSLRIDLLSYPYTVELSKLFDRMPQFPVEIAIKAIERVTKKPLTETFSAFDPNPIGSASIACVYQAVLRKNGKKVAVKVRRPGIGEVFAADFMILDLLSRLLEFLTIFRSGFTQNFRRSLRDALTEELDFHQEARYQELFRLRTKETKTSFIGAPRVYFDLSGKDVIVMGFASGIPLLEVLAAVEQKDQRGLEELRQLNIRSKKIARRLLWANHAAMIADLFFHSDPSPGNIFIKPNSQLVFIDFGATGAFSQSQRRALKQINYYQNNDDAEGMARASLDLMEPLPPIDVDAFLKELEQLFRTVVYAVRSKHSEWWERTSSAQWISFTRLSLKYNVPLPRGLLNMIRATLLYDTIAARLDKNIVFYNEFRRYEKFEGRRAQERLKYSVKQRLKGGPTPTDYLKMEQAIDIGNRTMYRFQRFLHSQPFHFIYEIEKWAFAVLVVLQGMTVTTSVTGIILLSFSAISFVRGQAMNVLNILKLVVVNGWYQVFVLIVILISIRRLYFRFADKEV